MARWIEGEGWIRRWYEFVWGHGLQGLRTRYGTGETRYQWWPLRVKLVRLQWPYWSLLNWHGIEEGRELYPFPVPNARRQVLPNPSWPGQFYERWERTVCAQVWHIGPLRIICGEHARPVESRLTGQHLREIETAGRTVVG